MNSEHVLGVEHIIMGGSNIYTVAYVKILKTTHAQKDATRHQQIKKKCEKTLVTV